MIIIIINCLQIQYKLNFSRDDVTALSMMANLEEFSRFSKFAAEIYIFSQVAFSPYISSQMTF